jgi:hypothetical protein
VGRSRGLVPAVDIFAVPWRLRRSTLFGVQAQPKPTKPTKEVQTLAPARNFALSLEQRIAAAMNGPPPYAARLRKIELLQDALMRDLAKHEGVPSDSLPLALLRNLERLNRLIEDHNRFFPIERNLPMDVATGDLMFRGERWRPMPRVSLEELRVQGPAPLRPGSR